MNPKIEVLCENDWLELKKLVDPDNNINGYVFSHEKRCQGKIIAIMPFRFMADKEGNRVMEILLRQEVTPCWDRLRKVTSAITGGFEKSDVYTALNELWEEAGYKVKEKELIPLGYCFSSKSSDTKYTLYTVDLTGKKKEGEAKGDGSKLEELANCYWANEGMVTEVWDPTVSTMFVRLLFLFKRIEAKKQEELYAKNNKNNGKKEIFKGSSRNSVHN